MKVLFITADDRDGTRLRKFYTEEARDAFALSWCADRWDSQWGDLPNNWPDAHEKVGLFSEDSMFCHEDVTLDDHPAAITLRGALDQIEALLDRDDVRVCSEAGAVIESALNQIDEAFGRHKEPETEDA